MSGFNSRLDITEEKIDKNWQNALLKLRSAEQQYHVECGFFFHIQAYLLEILQAQFQTTITKQESNSNFLVPIEYKSSIYTILLPMNNAWIRSKKTMYNT